MTIAGKRFGSWVVMSADATGKRTGCRCMCGTVQVIEAVIAVEGMIAVEALASGASTSCGCQKLAPEQCRALRDEAARWRLWHLLTVSSWEASSGE
jgi:hypothetical protein